jgi:hypothetical protein
LPSRWLDEEESACRSVQTWLCAPRRGRLSFDETTKRESTFALSPSPSKRSPSDTTDPILSSRSISKRCSAWPKRFLSLHLDCQSRIRCPGIESRKPRDARRCFGSSRLFLAELGGGFHARHSLQVAEQTEQRV